jgi:hypothetical protein
MAGGAAKYVKFYRTVIPNTKMPLKFLSIKKPYRIADLSNPGNH